MPVKMAVLKRIDPISLARVYAVISLIVGLIVGIFVALTGSLIALAPGSSRIVAAFGIASVIIFPIFYGVTGFVAGYVGALIYNIVAKNVGGVKLSLG